MRVRADRYRDQLCDGAVGGALARNPFEIGQCHRACMDRLNRCACWMPWMMSRASTSSVMWEVAAAPALALHRAKKANNAPGLINFKANSRSNICVVGRCSVGRTSSARYCPCKRSATPLIVLMGVNTLYVFELEFAPARCGVPFTHDLNGRFAILGGAVAYQADRRLREHCER